jgi:hypothetical protein
MRKRCLSCGAQFSLSGSGKRQKYSKCARRGDGRICGLSASKVLILKARGDFGTHTPSQL